MTPAVETDRDAGFVAPCRAALGAGFMAALRQRHR
jgi:hypothetical protein